jgi:hypothetical protein
MSEVGLRRSTGGDDRAPGLKKEQGTPESVPCWNEITGGAGPSYAE